MKLSLILPFLPLALALPGSGSYGGHHCCLTDGDAKTIISNWADIMRNNSAGFDTVAELVNATISDNFTSYEETFNNGASDVSFVGRANLIPGPPAGPSAITNLTFTTVYSFHDCGNIAYRWEYHATTTGEDKIIFGPGPNDFNPLNTTQVPKGSNFMYKGIDLLVVDPCTKKITSEYTSQDWLNFLEDIGWEFCPGK